MMDRDEVWYELREGGQVEMWIGDERSMTPAEEVTEAVRRGSRDGMLYFMVEDALELRLLARHMELRAREKAREEALDLEQLLGSKATVKRRGERL